MAAGEVRCGYCGNQFNAIGRLTDNPLLLPEPDSELMEYEAPADPEFSITSDAAPEMIEVLEDFAVDDELLDAEPQFSLGELTDDMEGEYQLNIDNIDNTETRPETRDREKLVDIPEILFENKNSGRNFYFRMFWGLGSLLLFLVLAGQLAWFNRDELLKQYPQYLPQAKQLCERFQCELIRQRNVHAIKLVNRDVRLHPIYKNTLLVNATITNRSDSIQPFPRVQFTLFNTNGGMVGFREFKPAEYLDSSMMISEGMLPDQPVHFALEVTGPAEGAVSFEFRFL